MSDNDDFRAKLLLVLGNRAKLYCEFCEIVGLWKEGLGVRCCHRQPLDPQPEDIQREDRFRRRNAPFFDFGTPENPDSGNNSRLNPRLRDDDRFREQAREVENGNERLGRLFGIKGESVLALLDSILFPWSFPPDYMHLILLGLLRKLHKILKGQAFGHQGAVDELELLLLDDEIWAIIGTDQKGSSASYPTDFGEAFNIDKVWSGMKAANWYSWAIQQVLIYLHAELRTADEYEFLKKVVFAVELASRRSLSWEEVDQLEILLRDVVDYVELNVYRCMDERLSICKPTFHQCRQHVVHGIRMCGPMPVYWQMNMEQKIGSLGMDTYHRYR
ncbi:hypothetical protein BJ508DRAFT_332804 [Ascobolus immersus RN42]|uniref:Uncharacterized protein n=1 Tax=Ascobolus immersus RN42 TaxID=1160509 RepID=A0A3N4HYI1_ASCIM|nr:hypothetical protein BJ508DRAFT_332804 [Ascobolus immersus RN42]